jgi:prepilin-type N-terminal cleavage/methylation domain-containing protein
MSSLNRMRPRGFSLLELAVTLAIAGFISAAAVSATVAIQRSFTAARVRLDQINDTRLVMEHILDKVRTAGGGRVRPWQAVAVTCAADGRTSLPAASCLPGDRQLRLLELEGTTQGVIEAACGTEDNEGSCAGFQPAGNFRVRVTAPGGVCPFVGTRPIPVVLVPPESSGTTLAQCAVPNGPAWYSAMCVPTTPCGCAFPEAAMGKGGASIWPAAKFCALTGGTVAPGYVSTYFIDHEKRALMLLKDFDEEGLAYPTSVAPNVVGFDARLLFDNNLDGDAETEREAHQVDANNTITMMNRLRMVKVGVAVGRPSKDGRTVQARLFNAWTSAEGHRASSLEGTALLRSTGVFQ